MLNLDSEKLAVIVAQPRESEWFYQDGGQPGLHIKFEASKSYLTKPCIKNKTNLTTTNQILKDECLYMCKNFRKKSLKVN